MAERQAYYRMLCALATTLILLTGIVQAQEAPPSLRMTSPLLPAQMAAPASEDTNCFSYGVSGFFTTKADGIRHGLGIGLMGFFDRFRPVYPSAAVSVVVSSLRVDGLPHADLIILSPNLDLTLLRPSGRLRPFAGVGIDLHYSYLSLNEPAEVSIAGYDSTTQARQIDMGWEITPHVLVGMVIPIGKKHQLLIEGRFMSASHAADVSYRDRRTGKEWHDTVNYSIPSAWLSVGIIWVPEPARKYGT